MDILALSFAQLLLGLFYTGIFVLICLLAFTIYIEYTADKIAMLDAQDESIFFDTITEFRSDFA